jgi:uncharacterized membrane protein
MKFCTNCGAQLADEAKFCTNCGTKMNTQPAPAPVPEYTAPAAVMEQEEPVQAPVQQAEPQQDDFWGTPAEPAPEQDDFWGAPAPAAPQPPQPHYQAPAEPQPPQPQTPAAPQQPLNYTQQFMQKKQAASQAQQNQTANYTQQFMQQKQARQTQQPQVQQAPNPYSQAAQQQATGAASTVSVGQPRKFMAILAYFGFLFLIPLFAAKKDPLARFHTNQGLVLFIISFVTSNVSNFIGELLLKVSPILTLISSGLFGIVSIACFVLSVIGVINAWKGLTKPLPIIGGIRILK